MASYLRNPAVIAARYIALLAGLVFAIHVGWYFIFPDVAVLKKENPRKTSLMLYMEKESLKKGKKQAIRQRFVPLKEISPYLVKAVLIAEDDKFWSHGGFDLEGMEKAMEKNLRKRNIRAGGSTITQQLAKNLYLTPSRNPMRKIKEAVLAWRLERGLGKARILELYLNVAEWGEGVFGAEAASLRYFGKPSSTLDPMEAARLAAVLPNPKRYRADGDSRYVANRATTIYNVMVKRGDVDETPEEQGDTDIPY